MNQSYWLILVFVATMVCNGICRPREVDVEKVYPVYRSEKQLEYNSTNRYEKPFNDKQNDESVTYLRIDIPYKNVTTFKTSEKSIVNNNTKSVIDYVPVALAVKKINVKKWPSDQNGIESSDDLSLYNIYTNNINPLNHNHATTQSYLDFTPRPFHKPSILIIEELTTRRPQHNRPDSVISQPIQVHNRPVTLMEIPQHPYQPVYVDPMFEKPTFTHPNDEVQSFYPSPPPPPPINEYYPEVQHPSFPPSTELPIHPTYVETTQQPVPVFTEQTTSNTVYVPSTVQPESTTKKRKKTKCPNVSIVATSSVNNNNILNKEGCQDINIHINTNLNNSVVGASRPPKGPNNTMVVVQSDQPAQSGSFGIFDILSAIITRIINFFFSNQIFSVMLAPFSSLLSGGLSLSSLILPWFIPHLLWGKTREKRLVILGKDGFEPIKYIYYSLNDSSSYLKRTKRNLERFQLPFWSWDKKKISRYSSETSTTKAEHVPEPVNQNPAKDKDIKFDIESIATVARASSDGPSLSSSAAIGHLIDTVGQMVDSDIRTPPKLKEIMKEKTNENRRDALGESSTPLPYTFVYEEADDTDVSLPSDFSEGKASHIKIVTDDGVKGIAIPVVMDDTDYEPSSPPKKLQKIPEMPKPVKEEKKKNSITKSQPTTTPSSGLSTWILLSDNREVTTPTPKKNNNKKDEDKKKTTGTSPTTKKPIKVQATTSKPTTQTNKKVTSKPTSGNEKKPENDTNSMSALEAMVKNQKKGVPTTQKPKTSENSKTNSQKKPTDPKKKFPDRLETAETKDKVEIELPDSRVTYTLPTNLPMTNEKIGTVAIDNSNANPTTENSVEGTTKKKSATKKKKKNKNRRRKPSSDTGVEAKIPKPPAMGSQIYNFLSREIVPTVGLGLIGVALTAGLASFLGYNPFVSSAVPLRRTYESHHGYTPNNYYNYNNEYGDGGQSEEVLFREVLSGMPEESRYGLTHTDRTYPEAYNRQDQYDSMKNPVYPTVSGSMYKPEKDVNNYDTNYPQDYSSSYGMTYDSQDKNYSSDSKDKYPVYTRETGTSFVYPETTGMTSPDKVSRGEDYATQSSTSDKYSKISPDTIERQPEALYRVAGESELQYRNGESTIQGVSSQNNWHRIGSPVDAKKTYSHLEPGPRSLDLSKEPTKTEGKKRVKRGTESVIQKISRKRTKKESDVENEIDFEDSINDIKSAEQNSLEDMSTTTSAPKTTTYSVETTSSEMEGSSTVTTDSGEVMSSTTEDVRDESTAPQQDIYETENESTAPGSSAVSVLDVLKRLAQFKLRLGLNFLRSTTDLFSRYLDDIQRRVDESFTNTTTTQVQYNRRKNPWSRIFFSSLDDSFRRRRSVLKDNQSLGLILTEDKTNDVMSKSMKKDLKPSNKIFHSKKLAPKKYESKRTN